MGKENDFKPLIQEQMALKSFCYLITWAVTEKVVKLKSMRDKHCNSMGPVAVHLILIFNCPLFWGIAGNHVHEKAYQRAFQFIYLTFICLVLVYECISRRANLTWNSTPSWLSQSFYWFFQHRVHQKVSYPLVLQTSTILNLVVRNPRGLVQDVLLKTQKQSGIYFTAYYRIISLFAGNLFLTLTQTICNIISCTMSTLVLISSYVMTVHSTVSSLSSTRCGSRGSMLSSSSSCSCSSSPTAVVSFRLWRAEDEIAVVLDKMWRFVLAFKSHRSIAESGSNSFSSRGVSLTRKRLLNVPCCILVFSTVFGLFIAENDLSYVAVGEMVIMSFTNTRMFLRSSGLRAIIYSWFTWFFWKKTQQQRLFFDFFPPLSTRIFSLGISYFLKGLVTKARFLSQMELIKNKWLKWLWNGEVLKEYLTLFWQAWGLFLWL